MESKRTRDGKIIMEGTESELANVSAAFPRCRECVFIRAG